MGSNFHKGRNYEINLCFDKNGLEFREVLFVVHVHILFNTNGQ